MRDYLDYFKFRHYFDIIINYKIMQVMEIISYQNYVRHPQLFYEKPY